MSATEWERPIPTTCDCCDCKIATVFIDGRTKMGPWGIMCPGCHRSIGVGLGTGKGQKFQQIGGKWLCVEGSSLKGGNATDDEIQALISPDDGSSPDRNKPFTIGAVMQAELTPQRHHRKPKTVRPPEPPMEPPDVSVGRLLEGKTDLAKWFRGMLAELDAVIDGPKVMKEFGLSSEQVRKYCKGTSSRSYVDDENPYIEGLGWDDPPPSV